MAKAHQESENYRELMFQTDEPDVDSWLLQGKNELPERETGHQYI